MKYVLGEASGEDGNLESATAVKDPQRIQSMNELLYSKPTTISMELYLSSLLTQYELKAQEITFSLQKQMKKIAQAVLPEAMQMSRQSRCYLSALRKSLKIFMDDEHKHRQNPGAESGVRSISPTSADIEILARLDSLKYHMQTCASALEENLRWNNCVSNMNQSLAAKELYQSADYLSAIKKCARALRMMPGNDTREKKVEAFSHQLEELVHPELMQSLRDDQSSTLGHFFHIYANLDRLDILTTEYMNARKRILHQYWFSNSTSQMPFFEWLPRFYEEILKVIEMEKVRCENLFQNKSQSILKSLVVETLESLRDSYTACLNGHEDVPSVLVMGLELNVDFFIRIAAALELNTCGDVGEDFFLSFFGPYENLLRAYEIVEGDFLTAQLNSLIPVHLLASTKVFSDQRDEESSEFIDILEGPDLIKYFSAQFLEKAHNVEPLIFDSFQRCIQFSCGIGFPKLLEALTLSTEHFVDTLKQLIPRIRELCGLPVGALSTKDLISPERFASFDWANFKGIISLLQTCGAYKEQMVKVDDRVKMLVQEQLGLIIPKISGGGRTEEDHLLEKSKVFDTVAFYWLKNNPTLKNGLLALQTRLSQKNEQYQQVLDEVNGRFDVWLRMLQEVVLDILAMPIRSTFSGLPLIEVWNKEAEDNSDELPSLHLLPQEYITSIADLLLSLLPQLEPLMNSPNFASNLLSSSANLEYFIDMNWEDIGVVLSLTEAQTKSLFYFPGDLYKDISNVANIQREEESFELATAYQNYSDRLANMNFIDRWSEILTQSTMGLYLASVLKIPQLNEKGIDQLLIDLEYFLNVCNAMDMDIHPFYQCVLDTLKLKREDLEANVKHIYLQSNTATSSTLPVVFKLQNFIAKKRSIITSFHGSL